MSDKHFNYFVIGGGSGGVRSARIAASHGAKVGLAEYKDLGGTCVNVGCVPKKLMAYASDFHADMEDARGFGWDIAPAQFHWPTFIEKKNTEIKRLNAIYQLVLENSGVEIFKTFARFIDAHTLDVGGEIITADKILIATGGKPRKNEKPWAANTVTSDDMFFLKEQPKSIVIEGGGYIGVEFAHILHGMGTKVTLVHRGDLFLRGFDLDLRISLAEEMKKQGINLLFDCKIEDVQKSTGGYKVLTTNGQTISTDLVLAAIGRDAHTEELNLIKAGVELNERGNIKVDKNYQTTVENIYAVGDITDTLALTPVAIAEGHVLADRLFGNMPDRAVAYDYIATAMFSNPPVSTVGMTEEEAKLAGIDITIFKTSFKPLKHTISGRDEKTMMKLVVETKTDKVIGVHMMGADSPEIMQGFAVALNAGATKKDFDRTVGIHPTAAEEFVTMRTAVKSS